MTRIIHSKLNISVKGFTSEGIEFMNTSVNSGYCFSRMCIYVAIINMTQSQLECEKNMDIVIVF